MRTKKSRDPKAEREIRPRPELATQDVAPPMKQTERKKTRRTGTPFCVEPAGRVHVRD